MTNALKMLVAMTALLVAQSAAAQIYKWVDEDGVVHYADQPLQQDAEQSSIASNRTDREAARDALAAAEALRNEQSQAFYQRRAGQDPDQQAPELTPEQIEYHRKSCDAARRKMNEFAQARRLYKLDENGAKAYLSEEEILAARADVQSAITEHCNAVR